MAIFHEEYFNTTEKMGDSVMEYAAQFIAQDFLEEYRSAQGQKNGAYVPVSFDQEMDPILKKGAAAVKRRSGKNLRTVLKGIAWAWIGVTSLFFIAVILKAIESGKGFSFFFELFS